MKENKNSKEELKNTLNEYRKNIKISKGLKIGISVVVGFIGLSLMFGGETYYDKIKYYEGDGSMEKSFNYNEPIKKLYKEWKEVSKEELGVEKISINFEETWNGKCPQNYITENEFNQFKKLNKDYENVSYKDFKYNEDNYWIETKTYTTIEKGNRFTGKKSISKCDIEAIKKDRDLKIRN